MKTLDEILQIQSFKEAYPYGLSSERYVYDIFISLVNYNITELRVTRLQMLFIALFASQFLGKEHGLIILLEGKIDKFLGIKLEVI